MGGKLATRKANLKKQTEIDLAVYKTMLDNIRDPFVVCQDGLIKYVNSRMLEMLIYDTELDLLGKGLDFIIHPEDSPAVLSNHKRRLRGEQFGTVYEFRVIRKDGEVVPIEIRVNVIEWEGRSATLNFLLDITDRKRVEAALRKSSELLHELFRSSQDIIAVFDQNGVFQYLSPSLIGLTGHQETYLIGKSCFEFILMI